MPIEVTLAKLSPTMETGQLVKWNVKVGDQVKEGDTLAEVQTDKAVMPMEAFEEGIVARLDVKEGDEIALGQRVLVLAQKGEDPKDVASRFESGGPKLSAPNQVKPAPGPVVLAPAATAVLTEATRAGDNGMKVITQAESGRLKASPLARKMAAAAGINLREVRGSGPGGRIVRVDVEAFHGSKAPSGQPSGTATTARASKRIPHSRMRQTIAQRMLQSKQSIPEIHLTSEIRMDQVVRLREKLNELWAGENVKLSLSDFVTKAVAVALRTHPTVNATWESDAIVEQGEINIGIAVALEGGLIVPVLHRADQLGLKEIRRGTLALAEAARASKLTPAQMMGSTFTISNLGMYGIRQFDAILNMPEVGILAVGSIEQRPVVENDQLAVGWLMTMTMTADHRVVDGATGAEFMGTLKSLLEEPALMLL